MTERPTDTDDELDREQRDLARSLFGRPDPDDDHQADDEAETPTGSYSPGEATGSPNPLDAGDGRETARQLFR